MPKLYISNIIMTSLLGMLRYTELTFSFAYCIDDLAHKTIVTRDTLSTILVCRDIATKTFSIAHYIMYIGNKKP